MKEVRIKCSHCGGSDYFKTGLAWRNAKKDVQRYRCRNCGKTFVLPSKEKKEG